MKTIKKFLIILTVMVISLITFSGFNKLNAEPGGPIYLGLETFRSSGYGYRQGGKKVWKIAQYDSPSDPTGDISQMIYCIKAGPGFGSSDMSSGNNIKISTYNQKFNLKDLSSIGSPYRDVLPTGENYNKLMWVLDHMYIIPENGDETAKNNFLRSVIPNERYSLLTNDDIDVVQQLAIWYFTNPTGEYHYETIELYINSMVNVDADYKTFEDLLGDDGWDRQDAASALYEYYINNADGSYVSPNATTSPIELDDSRASMEVSGSNLIAGPFRINELLDVDYTLTATYTNQNNQTISPRLGTKNTSGNVVATSKTLEDLVGQDFYLMIGTNTNTTTINITINASYSNKEITYWSVENAPNTEQPVVIITEKDYNFDSEASVSVNQGEYNLKLVKVDADNTQTKLSGAQFSVSINGEQAKTYETGSDGSITIGNIPITSTGTDTITITEIQAPPGYTSLIGTLTVEVEKTISGGNYTVTNADFTSSTNENGSTINLSGNTITVTVPNKKLSGEYRLKLVKKDADTQESLSGAVFSVKINDGPAKNYTIGQDGTITLDPITITETGIDTITIEEITPPTGYNSMIGTIILEVTKTLSGSSYVVSDIEFSEESQGNGTEANLSGGVITVTIPNKKQGGSYDLQIIKEDSQNQNRLSGAVFSVKINNGTAQNYTTDNNGVISINDIQITELGTDIITIEEVTPPTGYSSMIETLIVEVTKTLSGGEYVASGVEFGEETVAEDSHVSLKNGLITITVPNEKKEGVYNLQLIKEDDTDHSRLSGAVFSVRVNNGQSQNYTTGPDGTVTTSDIQITSTGTDTITIEEVTPPTGYNSLIDTLTLIVTKTENSNGFAIGNVTFDDGTNINGSTVVLSGNTIILTVPNKKMAGSYNLQLIKEDSADHSRLQGAVFNVSINGGNTQQVTTDDNGVVSINSIEITETGMDTITIEEITPPLGYNSLIGTLTVNVTKTISGDSYIASNAQFASGTNANGSTINLSGNTITVSIPNQKQTGVYNIQLIKEDSANHNRLAGAVFSVSINGEQAKKYTIGQDGSITLDPITITQTGTDTITIEEITPPIGYNSLIGTLTIEVTKTESNGSYIASSAVFSDDTDTQGSTINLSGNTITVNIPNEKQTGLYNIQLIKVDSSDTNKTLSGAVFNVQINDGEIQSYTTDANGSITINNIAITEEGTDTITIEETTPPTGYNKIIGTLKVNVEKTIENGEYVASSAVFSDDTNANGSTVNLNNNLITVTVPNSYFDLSLRKFITGVNDEQITNREPQVVVTPLLDGSSTTAIYNHTKQPVPVALGDIVIYTIRVYNEGQLDGYASEITDHLPAQLEFIPDHEINTQYRWVQDQNDSRTVRTDYLSQANEQNAGDNKLDAFNGTTLDYRDVQIACRVVQTDPMPNKITNIADITDFTDENGNTVTDRDSQEDNVDVPSDEDLPNYKDDEIDQDYVPGQQDDDDFEKLILKEFDLALRKFITKVNDNVITNREPQVDVTPLVNGTGTTAIYNHTKEPVKVTIGSVVEYTIRVYNEGQVDGYVEEIKDHIPAQLEFLPENSTNIEYGWEMLDANGNETQNVEEAVAIRTDYLSQANEQTAGENEIPAFDGQNLAYKDVKVAFRVIETDPMPEKITNIADISDFTDDDGNKVPDRDSEEDNVDVPSDEDLPNYKDDESDQDYVPGQQDDDDFEKVEIAEFDLSLRKFITAVNDSEITNRIPQVDVTPLIDGSGTTAIYNHPKDPVPVSNGNIVTYTIRVYNEGEVAGYASRIKDDIPEGLEFLPDNETNQEYRWVMLDEEGNVTENIEEAVALETDYLSKEQEQEEGANLIAPFDGENLDYRDVKIAFKVIEPNTSDRILINKAQISEDTDEDGNDVKDRDSTPDEWNEGEDDQDIEKVKVQYFDLSLRKWVTQAIVNKNGEETIIDTGHKAEDDPEDIVAVDLKDSEIATTTVKFRYSIRVTNEGNIAGYAKEVKDYIPEGLIFVAEDNPLWTQLEDGTIVTTQTENTLLEPGESTEVEVILTWDKEAQNFGVMDNWAEISKDDNDFDSPDIDSTPDNNVHGEDDIDDAPVMVTVKTGEAQVYIITTLSVLGILGTGITLIRKLVL